ncbi:hypothetical protein BH23ACT11_BH23ACT11_28080 [soil metagenome]
MTAEASEEEYVISLGELLQVLWKRIWVVLLMAIVLTGAAVGFSLGQTPKYEASIKILVGQEQSNGTPSQLGSDVQGLQQLTQTVADLVDTRPVAEAVIDRLGLQANPSGFLENLTVEPVANTQTIEVSYMHPDPEQAQRIANTVGDVFSQQVSEVSPSANAITATVWERAAAPEQPVEPNPLRNGLLALFLGLMLGVGLAFLLDYLDDSWRSPDEVQQVSGVPTYGIVPEFKAFKKSKVPDKSKVVARRKKNHGGDAGADEAELKDPQHNLSDRLVTAMDSMGVAAESYRTLRTNLLYALVDDPPKVITLTSAGPKEGKSTTCANLGVVLAQAGKRTLVVDCDLRKPVVHKIFGMRNVRGIVDVLAGQRELPEVWQEPQSNLKVVPVGPLPPNPAELLGSRRFADFLARARRDFDYVLVDAPPVGLVSDPAVVASQGDGVLLVLDAQNTRKGALRDSMRGLDAVGANVLGTVMNNVKKGKGGYYYGYTYE